MKLLLLAAGKLEDSWIREGSLVYQKKLQHYIPFELIEVKARKAGNPGQLKAAEASLFLQQLKPHDHVVVLDEQGKQMSSRYLAGYLQEKMSRLPSRLVLIIGGAYGFDQSILDRADDRLSLSSLTFTHQMARLICLEQLYRAFTILRNHPYHH